MTGTEAPRDFLDQGAIRKLRACCLAAALVALAVQPASAQNFPSRTMKIIVPYGVGGAGDLFPRAIAERLGVELGQAVVIDNKGGGMGMPAINDILNAPADGHVLLAADAGHWAITPATQKVPYDFLRDFKPLTLTYTNGPILYTGASSGINSLQDLIAQAKARPGQLNYASPGIASLQHLTLEMLTNMLGIEMKHIPFRGNAEVTESISRNDTQLSESSLGGIQAMLQAGKIKMLGLVINKRVKQIPDVPTVQELTGKEFNYPGQQGLVVRAATPQPIVDKLSAALRKVMAQPESYAKLLEATAADLTPTTPEQMTEYIRADIKKFTEAVRLSGAKAAR